MCTPAVIKTSITDHYLTSLSINRNQNAIRQDPLINIKTYCQKINYINLEQDISNETWEQVYEKTDVDQACDSFMGSLETYIQKHTTTSLDKTNSKHKRIKPWATTGLITSIRHRDKWNMKLKKENALCIKLKKPLDQHENSRYKLYRNYLTQLIRKTKEDFYQNKIQEAGNNAKQVWQIINEASGYEPKKARSKNMIPEIKISNENTTKNPDEIAEIFVNYFTEVGHNYATNILNKTKTNAKTNRPPQHNIKRLESSLFLNPVNSKELTTYINELKMPSAPGTDSIQVQTIKIVHKHILKPLCHIFNLSLQTGTFPSSYKTSVISPIFKSGDKKSKENYRPISLLTHLSKLLEKCIKTRLTNFMNKHNILSNGQFGFREGLSTENAIYSLTGEIYDALDKTQNPLVVLLDLAKAFDTVDHSLLLHKLEMYGVRGNCLSLIKSYLTDRTQTVKIGQSISKERTIKYGVPQGTVLGPLLFIIYINDICNLPIKGKIIIYADDTAIVFRGRTWNETINMAVNDLRTIYKWLQLNLLTLNLSKTVYIPFTTSQASPQFRGNIKIHEQHCTLPQNNCDCHEITQVDHAQYLGITLDRQLNWKVHINATTTKLRYCLLKFYRLKNILNAKTLKMVYFALIYSRLQYGIVGWGGIRDTHLEPLNIIQKHIIKVISNKPNRFPSEQLFRDTKLFDIRQIYMLKLVDINTPALLTTTKTHTTQSQATTTRGISKLNLIIPRQEKSIGQRHGQFIWPKLFNAIMQSKGTSYTKTKCNSKGKLRMLL